MAKKAITPRIEFVYSDIYDEIWEQWWYDYGWAKRTGKPYPKPKHTISYIRQINPTWRRQEKKITKEIAKVTGFGWKRSKITCYVVGGCRPFSDPLTLRPYKNPNDFVDLLTHELIHEIFSQNKNSKRYRRAERYVERKYKNESERTRDHILLHAVHAQIYIDLFGEERMKRDMALVKSFKDYRRSWGIVTRDGYKNLINKMK